MSAGDIERAIDQLYEKRKEAAAELAVSEEELTLLERSIAGSAVSKHDIARADAYRAGAAKGRAALDRLDKELVAARKRLVHERETAAKRPMGEHDRKRLDDARAYLIQLEEVERRADELAAHLREAYRLVGAAFAGSSTQLAMLGNFRVRVTAGLMAKFELNSAAGGLWGRDRALIDLGESKNRGDIAKAGLAAYERAGLKATLPPHIGDAL